MNELIWFSVPGAVGLYALHLAFPGNSSNGGLLVIASAPILGFILHQLYRTVFEACHGWETLRRPVLALIKKEYNLDDGNPRLPFLIWETSFYSDGVPDSFREHNRSGWHYVMSFRLLHSHLPLPISRWHVSQRSGSPPRCQVHSSVSSERLPSCSGLRDGSHTRH